MKMRAHKRRIMGALASTVRFEVNIDADLYADLRRMFPRGVEAGIRDIAVTAARRKLVNVAFVND
jgi:hypothetical protein